MDAWLVALVVFLIVMVLLALGFAVGRVSRAKSGPPGDGSWIGLVCSSLFLLFSVVDLIGAGIVTIWFAVPIFGFFLGRTVRQRDRTRPAQSDDI